MTYLLDTNVCIRILTNSHHLVTLVTQKFSSLGAARIAICSVVKAELYYGARKSPRQGANHLAINKFCNPLLSLPFDDSAAHCYGQIRAQLESVGSPIGPNDLFIASIAIFNGLILAKNDTREFSRVAGLQIEDGEI